MDEKMKRHYAGEIAAQVGLPKWIFTGINEGMTERSLTEDFIKLEKWCDEWKEKIAERRLRKKLVFWVNNTSDEDKERMRKALEESALRIPIEVSIDYAIEEVEPK